MSILESAASQRRQRITLLVAFLFVTGLGGLYLRLSERAAPPRSPSTPTAAALTQLRTEPQEQRPAPVPESSLRSLFEAVSSNPHFRSWLAHGDVLHRWAVVADNLAEGVTPRSQLRFLGPSAPFSTERAAGREVIAAASFRRYDAFADAVASVDAAALARAYRAARSQLEVVYRALGYPGASLDRLARLALDRLERAPVEAEPVAVEEKGARWVFAEARLEGLDGVEKQLLRMGPRNMRLVQEKAREVRRALALDAHADSGAGQKR
jgi:hypothetical protein